LGCSHFLCVWLVFIRPVDEQWSSNEALTRSKTPKPAVVTIVAVVAHHEKVICRDTDRAEVVTAIHFTSVDVHDIWFVQLPAVDVYVTVPDFESFAGQADHAFHQTHVWRLG